MVLDKSEIIAKSTDVQGPLRDSRGETTTYAISGYNIQKKVHKVTPRVRGHHGHDSLPQQYQHGEAERSKFFPDQIDEHLELARLKRKWIQTARYCRFEVGRPYRNVQTLHVLSDAHPKEQFFKAQLDFLALQGLFHSSLMNTKLSFPLDNALGIYGYRDTTKRRARMIWTEVCFRKMPHIIVYRHCPLLSKLASMFVLCDIHRSELRIKDWQNAHGKVGITGEKHRARTSEPVVPRLSCRTTRSRYWA